MYARTQHRFENIFYIFPNGKTNKPTFIFTNIKSLKGYKFSESFPKILRFKTTKDGACPVSTISSYILSSIRLHIRDALNVLFVQNQLLQLCFAWQYSSVLSCGSSGSPVNSKIYGSFNKSCGFSTICPF